MADSTPQTPAPQSSTNKSIHEVFLNITQDGIQRQVPALSEKWVIKRCYTKYVGLPVKDGAISDGPELNEWLYETDWFNKDLMWILGLEYNKFWSHMIYDSGCMECVVSFLQEATPFYMPVPKLTTDENVIALYDQVLKNIWTIMCRLITSKESETEWMTKSYLASTLYSKYLITVPIIFDVLVAYGRSNVSLLIKMIHTIITIEPKYLNDLKIGLKFMQNSFAGILKKINGEEDDKTGPISMDDLTMHCLDCAGTLCMLLESCADIRQVCSDIKMESCISNFYDNSITLLYKNIFFIDPNSPSLKLLNNIRVELINSYRIIINLNLENVLRYPDKALVPGDNFLSVLTESLSDRTFIQDYQLFYPIQNDLELLREVCPDLEDFKINFVQDGFVECVVEKPAIEKSSVNPDLNGFLNKDEKASHSVREDFVPVAGAMQSREIENEVKIVHDMLPNLGDGFIRKVLSRYENTEAAIAAILEGNLPPDLDVADKTEPYIPPEKGADFYVEHGISRLNVFDGDDYDVMTHDKPKGIIKIGKGMPGPKTFTELLDDKSHVQDMKTRYQDYSIVCDDNEYDDEYDDSYDALADSEAKTIKTKSLKDALLDEVEDDEDESGESEEEANKGRPIYQNKKNDFCENPEIARQRYEQSRQSKYNARYGNRGGGSGGGGGSRPASDVVGKPKGQGQSDNTVASRNKKNTQKASRANHNRKQGASYKRGGGMMS